MAAAAATTTATTTGDNGDEEDWLAGLTVSRAATVSIRARGRAGCAPAEQQQRRQRQQQRDQRDQQDQVQVKIKMKTRPQTSAGRQPPRPDHNPARQTQEETSWPCVLSERRAQPATAPSGREVMSANVRSRHNLRRRRRGRCRASTVGLPDASEAKEAEEEAQDDEKEENGNARCRHYESPGGTRRARARLAELRGARAGKSRSVSMWPSWRQIVLISFLSLALASLLSTMLPRAVAPALASGCLLFKHCHALSVSSSGQPGGNSVGQSNKSLLEAADKAPAAAETAEGHSVSTEAARALGANQRDEQASPTTTAPATGSLRAPTTTVWPSTSSLDEAAGARRSPAQVAEADQQQRQSSRPLSPIEHWFQQQQQQARLTQLGNSNETSADSFASHLEQISRNKDNNGRGGRQQQHFLSADNYRADASQDDNNGSRRASLASGQAASSLQSLRPLASSITRADLQAGRPLAESAPAAIAASHRDSSAVRSIGSGERQQQQSSGGQSGANFATVASSVPNSSAASALRLIASPALALPSEQAPSGHQQSGPARRRLNSTSQVGAARPQALWTLPSGLAEESRTEAPLATGANTTTPTMAPMTPTTTPATIGLELGEPEELLLSRASGRSSTPAAHSQPAAARRQFLMPAGLPHGLLQSAVREALNDLMVSTGEQIFSAASAARPLVLRPHSLVAALVNGEFSLQQQQQLLPAGLSGSQFGADLQGQSERPPTSNKQQEGLVKATMSTASSASAPSISLPPLSHLLSPRNPFRLFASSSAPAAIRYRPAFLHSSGSNKPASSSNRWLLGSSRIKKQQQQQPQSQPLKQAQTGFASFANLDGQQQFPVPMLPASFFQSANQLPSLDEQASSSTPSLYAHSHSARQLEQLVRAASQSSGLQSPPILPAIVSAPAGAIPGFYIPAIESESESQVSELRHGEQVGSAANSLVSSKIPGTDYILHPDEVRAMIGIGELAWRAQQQQQQQQMKGEGRQASNLAHRQVAATNLQPQQGSESQKKPDWNAPINHYQIGWAPENHVENMRDYSYVDAQMRRENMQAAHSSISQQQQPNQQRQHYNQQQQQMMANSSSSELAQQLARHFGQHRLKAFPAIIRVNDQDYVHWPLIKIGTADATSFDSDGRFRQVIDSQNQVAGPFQQNARPGGQENRNHHHHHHHQQQPLANQESRLSSAPAPALNGRQPRQEQPGRQLGTADQQQQDGQSDLEHSPVRLATQLTPNEIRQVEDSIVEALIMSQTLQHQRKLMEHLAANQNAPVFVRPPAQAMGEFWWPAGDANGLQQQQQQQKQRQSKERRFRNGLFGRRRRRNSANQQQPRPIGASNQTMAAAESSLQLFPLLDMSEAPVRVLGPLMRYDSLEDSATDLAVAGEPQDVGGQSRRPQRYLPVVMADQETNKPSLLAESQAPPLSSLETPLLSESSETRASILSPSAATLIAAGRRAMRPSERSAATQAAITQPLVFGSRVSAPKSIQEQQRERQQSSSPSQALDRAASATRGQQAPLNMGPLYDDDNEQAGRNFVDQQRQADRPHRQRINVDWPGMASDADYFPRPTGSHANRGEHSPTGLHPQQQVSPAESSRVGDNSAGASAGTWPPGKSFVTSQLKLQFAHDYQAREGVPIYNNNVRVAGGLERQRSLASQPRHQVSAPLEASSEEDPEELGEFDDDNDKTGAGDLLQRGSSESRGVEPKTHQVANAKRPDTNSRESERRQPRSRTSPQLEPNVNDSAGHHKLNHRNVNHAH